jgi:glutathione S-transferase
MAEYKLYCFAQSGNAYRAALMLNLVGADWEPVWVDFFKGGVQRTPAFREEINEMGEAPVLIHGKKKLTQSGVILTYLANKYGKFQPQGEDEQLECLRWMLFDNQKVGGYLGPYRFTRTLSGNPDEGAMKFLKPRIDNALGIVNKRLANRKFLLGERPAIADLSMCGYMYYPADEYGFDIPKEYPAIGAWLERIKAFPGWKHPYELMPGYPLVR